MKRLLLVTLLVALFSWAGTAFACPPGQFRVDIDPVCGADELIAAGNDVYFLFYKLLPTGLPGELIHQEAIEGDGFFRSGCVGGATTFPMPVFRVKIGYCRPWESRLHIAWAATTYATEDNNVFCTDFGSTCAECPGETIMLNPKMHWMIGAGGTTEDSDFSTVKSLY